MKRNCKHYSFLLSDYERNELKIYLFYCFLFNRQFSETSIGSCLLKFAVRLAILDELLYLAAGYVWIVELNQTTIRAGKIRNVRNAKRPA